MKQIICGFEIEGKKYGWLNQELYRLPFISNKKQYRLRKIKLYEGRYRIGTKSYYTKDLEDITHVFDNPYIINECKNDDTPF